MNAWPTCFGNYQPIKTSSTHVIYLRDTSKNGGREPTLFKFIEAVHNCPAVWDVSSLIAYEDTNKNKQNKTEERADKLGFVQTFLFLHRFLFLLFFSSVSLLLVLLHFKKGPCCKLPCLLFGTSLTCEGKSLSTFRSFPTVCQRVCQPKFAV